MALWEPHDLEIFERIRRGATIEETDASLKDLINGGFAFPGYVDEVAVLDQQYRKHRFDRSTMILTIAPTVGCNFGCDYCFQGEKKNDESMSRDIQDRIVGLVKRVSPGLKRLHVAWYGGEPLLRLKIIENLSDHFISFCDSHAIQYDSMIVTNGYLLRPSVARSLHVHRVKTVQITLDGQQIYHDSRRPLLSGGPTFDHIVKNIKSVVDEVPINFSIRVNIDSRNVAGIHGLIENLAEMGLGNKRNFKLYFAPIEATTEACHSIAGACMPKGEYGTLEADLYRLGFESGLTVLPYPPRFRGSCGAVRPTGLVLLPNGDIHKCWHAATIRERRVGTLFDLDALNQDQLLREWLLWNPFEISDCRKCKILPNCAGGCGYKFLYSEDAKGEGATLPCISWKYNINEMLILRAVKLGIITADDYDPAAIATDESMLQVDPESCRSLITTVLESTAACFSKSKSECEPVSQV